MTYVNAWYTPIYIGYIYVYTHVEPHSYCDTKNNLQVIQKSLAVTMRLVIAYILLVKQ